MKYIAILAGLALVAGCATTEETAAIDTTEPVMDNPGYAPGSQGDLEANAGHRVFFGYDEYNLTPQAQETLRKQAEWMLANPGVSVQLAGNADERGTREYNLALGARRFEAAKSYLVSLGVAANRLQTVSNGKEKPIAIGSNEASWAQNRNSTTLVTSVAG